MQISRLLAALTLVAAPLMAQSVPASNAEDLFVQRVQALLDLPRLTAEVRDAGVSNATVWDVLNAMEQAKLPETEQVALLTTERDAARLNGPSDNFGAFVQSRLAAGDRGQVLAKAIRAAHAARSSRLRRQTEFPRGPEHKEAAPPSKTNPN